MDHAMVNGVTHTHAHTRTHMHTHTRTHTHTHTHTHGEQVAMDHAMVNGGADTASFWLTVHQQARQTLNPKPETLNEDLA